MWERSANIMWNIVSPTEHHYGYMNNVMFEGLLFESASIMSDVPFMCSMSWTRELHKLPPLLPHLGHLHAK